MVYFATYFKIMLIKIEGNKISAILLLQINKIVPILYIRVEAELHYEMQSHHSYYIWAQSTS